MSRDGGLLPCPLCNGPVAFCTECNASECCHRIVCAGCKLECDLSGDDDPETLAELQAICAERWNRRTPATRRDGWRSIESAPRGEEVWFWLRPKNADETYYNTSGQPILSTAQPCARVCKYGQWGALWTATHWQPHFVPEPPAAMLAAVEPKA